MQTNLLSHFASTARSCSLWIAISVFNEPFCTYGTLLPPIRDTTVTLSPCPLASQCSSVTLIAQVHTHTLTHPRKRVAYLVYWPMHFSLFVPSLDGNSDCIYVMYGAHAIRRLTTEQRPTNPTDDGGVDALWLGNGEELG